MGDFLLNSSRCPSFVSFPHLSGRFIKGFDVSFVYKDQRNNIITRVHRQAFGNLQSVSHPQRNISWKALLGDQLSPSSYRAGERSDIVKDEEDLNIFERLSLAWRVLFPQRKKPSTPAEIAKQRLKMILISDRCSVNDNAKRKIVSNIVGALANFVEIESQDRIRLNVSTDPDLGMVYSVSVPVRRVKPEYQDNGDDVRDDFLKEGDLDPVMEELVYLPVMESAQLEMSMATSQEGDANGCFKGVQDIEA